MFSNQKKGKPEKKESPRGRHANTLTLTHATRGLLVELKITTDLLILVVVIVCVCVCVAILPLI